MDDKKKEYPTWEILALIIGFVGSAGMVPELVNLILNRYENPLQFTRLYKGLCIGLYFLFLLWIASWQIYRIKLFHSDNSESSLYNFNVTYYRKRILNFIRQFPLSIFNKLIFYKYQILSYDIFNRDSEWPEKPELFDTIGRFRLKEKTIEIQYPRNFSRIQIRETLPNSTTFDQPQRLEWLEFKFKWLTTTSFIGTWWTTIHLIKSLNIYNRFLNLTAILYLIESLVYTSGLLKTSPDLLNITLETENLGFNILMISLSLLTTVGLFLKKRWGHQFLLLTTFLNFVTYIKLTQFESLRISIKAHLLFLCLYFLLTFINHKLNRKQNMT